MIWQLKIEVFVLPNHVVEEGHSQAESPAANIATRLADFPDFYRHVSGNCHHDLTVFFALQMPGHFIVGFGDESAK